MYKTLLSALLLGLFPSSQGISTDYLALGRVAIAPPSDEIVIEGALSASGVVIYDMGTGQRIFAKESRVHRPMASLTKLMTALIIAENHEMNETVTIPQNVVDVTGNKAYLPPGKRFTVGDLLSALLINSANDAAVTLAQFHSGSVPGFVEEMNKRALQLGMTGTSFRNPAGLDHPAHWSTPQDIAGLSMFALGNPEVASRMGKAGTRIASYEGDSIQLYHTHVLLHETSPVVAGKTGTTNDAGQCLMSIVEHEGKQYLVVIMHSSQRYKDMKTILSTLTPEDSPVANLQE